MDAVFLSASVPVLGRGDYYKTANPFLIQSAVREFLVATLGRRLVVWGGHPAITPMVWAACESLGISYADAVVLYQSKFFKDSYPEENAHFKNVVFTEAVEGDRAASLRAMRLAMLSRKNLRAAVFIGGMEGVFDEYSLFTKLHPKARIVTVASAGGAARELAAQRGEWRAGAPDDLNYVRLFHDGLGIGADEQRIGQEIASVAVEPIPALGARSPRPKKWKGKLKRTAEPKAKVKAADNVRLPKRAKLKPQPGANTTVFARQKHKKRFRAKAK